MSPLPPRRHRPLQGAIVTAALPVITLAGLGAGATAAHATAPAGKAPTARNLFEARAQVTAHVRAAKAAKDVIVTVKAGDSVWALAARHGVSVASVLKLNNLSASSYIHPGDRLIMKAAASSTTSSKASANTSSPASKPASSSRAASHTVKAGDTLSGIAHRYDVSLSTLLKANGIKASDIIYPGQRLRLSTSSVAAASGSSAKPTTSKPTTTTVSRPAASAGTYTIKAGDTLSGIAAKNKVSVQDLLKANGLQLSSTIYAGRSLKLPTKAAASTPSTGSIPKTFLTYTYSDETNRNANASKATLNSRAVPSKAQMRAIIVSTAKKMGVDPDLALAHAIVESGLDARAVSPANAVGVMQVMPSTGEWMGQTIGRKLDLLDPYDNVTAGVAYIRYLQRAASSQAIGIAAYYQGLAGVNKNGMKPDTKDYLSKVQAAMRA